jgi:uncharacterized LabA/DUF88 family protein
VSIPPSSARVGIFVDGGHLSWHGGKGMRYDVLREFASRDGAEPLRMNVYVPLDAERARQDPGYRRGQDSFCSVLRDFGYKVVQRRIRPAVDDNGDRCARAGTALELAVDALHAAESLDRVLLVTGDEDQVPLVRAMQARGVRVEVVAFDDASGALREEADAFLSGYLVPNLLPIPEQPDRAAWGELGHRARGVCYNHAGKGYGFLRFLRRTGPALWITDSRHPDSPYETVFFHDSQLPRNVSPHQLPSRGIIFEFETAKSDRFDDDVQAINLRVVSGGPAPAPARGRVEPEAPPEVGRGRDDAGEEPWIDDEDEGWDDEGLEEAEIDAEEDRR